MAPKSLYSGKSNELYDVKVREVIVELKTNDGLIIGLRVDVSFDAH